MSATESGGSAELWAVVVTYRRPEALEQMLSTVAEQSRQPDHMLVVDNDADAEVAAASARAGATYVDAGGNIGPAGGVALAMSQVVDRAGPDDWIVCLDDDDPPWRDDLFEILWEFAHRQLRIDPMTACVGSLGGVYRRELGIFRRLEDQELVGAVPVDYVGGNVFPMYRCRAVKEVGTFDPRLFWGFEEGEYGLRLRKAGRSLYVCGGLALDYREHTGQLNRRSTDVRSAPNKAAWRRYYGVRNAVVLGKRYGRFWTPLLVGLGGALRGVVGLARLGRPMSEVVLPARGALDGLIGRLGLTVDPGFNRKVD